MPHLTLRQLQFLFIVGRCGPLSLHALAEHLQTTPTATRNHLATLEHYRLVQNLLDGAFDLTPAGVDILEDEGYPVPPLHNRPSRPDTAHDSSSRTGAVLLELPVDAIDPSPWQVRHFRDDGTDLVELAASIRWHGIIQPILVRPRDSRYELVVGERRLRACRLAPVETVLAVVRDLSDDVTRNIALVNHLHQLDLRPLEESDAVDLLAEDNDLDPFQMLFRFGRSGPWIGHRLSLQSLVTEWQNAVRNLDAHFQDLSAAHLQRIAQLPDHQQRRLLLADELSYLWWHTHRADPTNTRTPRLPTLAQLDQAIEHATTVPSPAL